MMWRLIAWIVTRPRVATYLIERAKRTPYRDILGPNGEVYMHRWWLFNPYPHDEEARLVQSWWRRNLPSIRVHHILEKDQDRHLHDHPWNARTVILRGWYLEARPHERGVFTTEAHLRNVGHTGKLQHGSYHRIVAVADQGTHTLFITGKYRGTWGFMVDGDKIPWREYLFRPWHPSTEKPPRAGVYETEDVYGSHDGETEYRYWDGRYWSLCETSVERAMKHKEHMTFTWIKRWRRAKGD